jgi:hypothetical protein
MMRKTLIIPALLIGAAGMLVGALPASAATSGGTPMTVEVGGGALSITVPGGPVDLGSVPAGVSAQTVSAPLGQVTVTDNRAGTAGWTTTVGATDFTGPQSITVSTPGSVTYTAPAATVTGTANVANSNQDHLFPDAVVQTATGVSGPNTAAWNPTLAVRVPAGALAGTYSSTITHSVA